MDYILKVTAYIIKGSKLTFELYFITLFLAIPLGVVLAVLASMKNKILKKIIGIYTWILRGTPLLLQLFFVYYGLTIFGITLTPFFAASLTFILNYAAYFTEIFRGGIESIEPGQYEAAKALSMSYPQTMKRIIVPQTLKRSLPAICNEAISLVKDTALVIVIGMGELLRSAKEIFTRDFRITPFVVAAILYLMITWVIVYFFRKLEKRYSYYE